MIDRDLDTQTLKPVYEDMSGYNTWKPGQTVCTTAFCPNCGVVISLIVEDVHVSTSKIKAEDFIT